MVRKDQDPDEARSERRAQAESARSRVAHKHKEQRDLEDMFAEENNSGGVDGEDVLDVEFAEEPSEKALKDIEHQHTGASLSEKEGEADEQELHVVYGKEIIEIDPSRIRRQKGQPREEFDEEDLKDLEESIRVAGQIIPGLVIRVQGEKQYDYELDDGERRWICCGRIGIPFKAIVIEVGNKAQQFAVSAIANFGRAPHTRIELAKAIVRMRAELGWGIEKTARALSISAGYAYQHLALLKLHPDVQSLTSYNRKKEEQLQMPVANSLVKFPQEEQLKHAQHILKKRMRVDAARRYLAKEAATIGIIVQTRKQNPSAKHRSLMRFLDITEDRLKKYLDDLSPEEVAEMFRARSETHILAVRRQIGTIAESFEKIKRII